MDGSKLGSITRSMIVRNKLCDNHVSLSTWSNTYQMVIT